VNEVPGKKKVGKKNPELHVGQVRGGSCEVDLAQTGQRQSKTTPTCVREGREMEKGMKD